MDRREFLKRVGILTGAAAGALMFGGFGRIGRGAPAFAQDRSTRYPDLAAVRGGEPDAMFDRGITALGGMEHFVKTGNTVVIKPNMAWDRGPETRTKQGCF